MPEISLIITCPFSHSAAFALLSVQFARRALMFILSSQLLTPLLLCIYRSRPPNPSPDTPPPFLHLLTSPSPPTSSTLQSYNVSVRLDTPYQKHGPVTSEIYLLIQEVDTESLYFFNHLNYVNKYMCIMENYKIRFVYPKGFRIYCI